VEMAASTLNRLLRFLPLAALGVVLAGSAPAEAEAAESTAATIDAPFLWQIDGGDKPSYLFGTIHAGVDAEELPSIVSHSLRSSEFYVMETSPGDVYPPASHTTFPMGTPMDLSLADEAHQHGSRVGTLESMRFQLDLLKQVGSAEELAAMLADDSQAIEPLIDAYRAGDVDEISAVTDMSDPAMRDVLLTQRNHRWVHKLGRVLAAGGAFIAVGVGHIPGEHGLLDLLDQRGYSISRMA
jgi:uncharacterized protein YbaP (TraB family)